MKKTVLMEIEVPEGDWCWNFKTGEICQHFDNHMGANCPFFGWLNNSTENGYPKAYECLKLKVKDEHEK
ncbi:hypothetical protein E2P63_03815 [Candidatus Bathyarchaeota archaeon]|nr:hypothetical protein E2P63_03815 [Candidatus Bathyarchaeota archaeon]